MHPLIIALFVSLLACVFYWLLIQRNHGANMDRTHAKYRHHQILIGLIASLTILLALLIIFSSEPGITDDYMWWP